MFGNKEVNEIQKDLVIVKEENKKIKDMTTKLAQSMGLQSEVLRELTGGITDIVSTEVKNQLKEEFITATEEMRGSILSTVGNTITDTVRNAVCERGLNRIESTMLTKARGKKMKELLGFHKSDKYILFNRFYQWEMMKKYKKLFDVVAYADVRADRFEEALEYINNFTVTSEFHDWCVKTLHKDYINNEIEDNKKLNAYRRYFGLVKAE